MALRHLTNSALLMGRKSLSTTIFKQATVQGINFARAFSTGGPKVQSLAPHFSGTAVVQNEFKTISLNDFSGKYLYLFFYPMDFTFVCPTEIIAFSDRMADFEKLETAIVGCSCDSHFSHLAWIQTPRKKGGLGEIKYPLLADFKKIIARDYNVLLENDGVPLRGSFLIDPKGVIRQVTINDLPVGRSVDEVLRLIKAFQFVDTHGEVCPANWNPDKPTIKPNPRDSIEYFNKVNPS
ncbi:peroxiredoxin-2-like isoform X2 [Cimex lectularius]|uniref:thioredoxin-dependent peroxiredoxin n=1 Tax=Cimex lectularius TaxID=79782 RepID=A0A8I6RAP1_CIMLE|nr:peroxiredoxin-2-like isoform X2 [Cimex lectularius]